MKKYHGYCLPISMQKEFASIVKAYASQNSLELEVDNINTLFHNTYIKQTSPITLRVICFEKAKDNPSILYCKGKLLLNGESIEIYGEGNGALHTVLNALKTTLSLEMEIDDYCQHALGHTAMSKAASYVKLFVNNKRMIWGVGVDDDATLANIRALISAVNRTMDVKND
jgi:2-isopropylmalate synthase